MIKKYFRWWLLLILLLAAFLRFFRLGQVPHGMTWDEAAIGYNGYAIFKTHRDEWLNFLPVSFQSFGDYKAPLAIYLSGIFTTVGGMNLVMVRVPFAVAGVLAVWALVLLTKRFLGKEWALLAGALLALCPWHLHFSRAGFEAGLSLSFFLWSLVFFWRFVDQESFLQKIKSWWQLIISTLLAVAAVYSYHSAKLVVPLVMLILVIWQRKKLIKRGKALVGSALLSGGLLAPMIWDSIKGQGLERLDTTIFNDLQGWALWQRIGQQYLQHLSPRFLLLGQTTTLRHGGRFFGYLLPGTFILIIAALVLIFYFWRQLNNKTKDFIYLSLILIGVGLVPAAIGEEVPHANRALLALPGFLLLATFGAKISLEKLNRLKINRRLLDVRGKNEIMARLILGTLLLFQLLFFTKYLSSYYHQFARESAEAFKDGYLEAFQTVVAYEDQVDKILFTSEYGQPYIYALFVRETNPIWYQGGSLRKYEFTDKINSGDLARDKTIVVASGADEIEPNWADKLIYGSDGQLRFKIYLPEELKK